MLLILSAAMFLQRLCWGLGLQGKAAHILLRALMMILCAGIGFGARAATLSGQGCAEDSVVESCIREIEDAVSPRLPRPTPPDALILPGARGPAVGPLIRGLPASPVWREWRASYAPALRQPMSLGVPQALAGLAQRAKGVRVWAKTIPLELRKRPGVSLPPVEMVVPVLAIQNLVVGLLGGQTVELRMRMLRVVVAMPAGRPTLVAPSPGPGVLPFRPAAFQPFPQRPQIAISPAPAPVPLAPSAAALAGGVLSLLGLRGVRRRVRKWGI